jgi:general secretion pathway protein A
MYLKYFGLKKEPFHITTDPEFLYLSASHREALASIIYGIDKRKGFISITGAVGVGKTTILKSYLEKTDRKKIKAIYIFNPNVSFKYLLKLIHQELGTNFQSEDVFEMVNQLHTTLIGEYRKGHNVILVIDEAQNTPIATLENLRMLSNLETAKEKLIQMVLVGQPELELIFKKQALRQIDQRIAIRSVIKPLSSKDSRSYIEHRLTKAMADEESIFTECALKKIIRTAKGIPRTMNIICDNALIASFGYRKRPVTARIVREVISDMNGADKTPLKIWNYALPGFAFAAAAAALLTFPLEKFRSNPSIISLPHRVAKADPIPESAQAWKNDSGTILRQNYLSKRYPVFRVARKGDNLSSLALDVYGFCDNSVLDHIRRHNPFIKNINMILAGHEIIFPELDNGATIAFKN